MPGLIPAHAGKTDPPIGCRSRRTAHPRSRGENSRQVIPWLVARGSSPLTRGKLLRVEPLEVSGRLIPAHAGKTELPEPLTGQDPAHPRSRGENTVLCGLDRSVNGSSPLTRGKHIAFVVHELADRLIPAHAGKTYGQSQDEKPTSAHPRSRGENAISRPSIISVCGSSPLTRGKLPESHSSH